MKTKKLLYNLNILTLLFFLLLTDIKCFPSYDTTPIAEEDIKQLSLPKKNPTSWIFPASLLKVRKCFTRQFGIRINKELIYFFIAHYEKNDTSLLYRKYGIRSYLSRYAGKIFSKPENENDLVFYNHSSNPLASKTHFTKNKPMDYYAEFHLHFTEITPNKTKAEVFTVNPEILLKKADFGADHGQPEGTIFKKVEASTVEEYLILLNIGRCLKIKMPKLKLPQKYYPDYKLELFN